MNREIPVRIHAREGLAFVEIVRRVAVEEIARVTRYRTLEISAAHGQRRGAERLHLVHHLPVAVRVQIHIRRPAEEMRPVGRVRVEVVVRGKVLFAQGLASLPVGFQPPLDAGEGRAVRRKFAEPLRQHGGAAQLRPPVGAENVEDIVAGHRQTEFAGKRDLDGSAAHERGGDALRIVGQQFDHHSDGEALAAGVAQRRGEITLVVQFPCALQPAEEPLLPQSQGLSAIARPALVERAAAGRLRACRGNGLLQGHFKLQRHVRGDRRREAGRRLSTPRRPTVSRCGSARRTVRRRSLRSGTFRPTGGRRRSGGKRRRGPSSTRRFSPGGRCWEGRRRCVYRPHFYSGVQAS